MNRAPAQTVKPVEPASVYPLSKKLGSNADSSNSPSLSSSISVFVNASKDGLRHPNSSSYRIELSFLKGRVT